MIRNDQARGIDCSSSSMPVAKDIEQFCINSKIVESFCKEVENLLSRNCFVRKDPPMSHYPNGPWFLDIVKDDKAFVVDYRPECGFGITNREIYYGEKWADKYVLDPIQAAKEVYDLWCNNKQKAAQI